MKQKGWQRGGIFALRFAPLDSELNRGVCGGESANIVNDILLMLYNRFEDPRAMWCKYCTSKKPH